MKSIKALSLCLALGLAAFVNAASGAQVAQTTNEVDKTHAASHTSCPNCSMKHSGQHHDAAQSSTGDAQAKHDCDDCCAAAGCADCTHDCGSCCAMHHEGGKDGAPASCATCKMGAHKAGEKMCDASGCQMHGAHHEHAAGGASHEHGAAHAMHAGADGEGCCECCAAKTDAK